MSTHQTLSTTYTATVSPSEEGVISLLVTKDITGGICGPFSNEVAVLNTDHAEAVLASWGYSIDGPWTFRNCYDGLRISASLTPAR